MTAIRLFLQHKKNDTNKKNTIKYTNNQPPMKKNLSYEEIIKRYEELLI